MPSPNEIREQITTEIIEAMERGCPPWRRPWCADPNAGVPKNVVSGKSYSGVNPLLLQLAADRHGFTSRWWATFNQWRQLGGTVTKRPEHVAPGTWGTRIVFCKPVPKRKADAGDDVDERYWVLRTFVVFCLDQVEGAALDHLRAGSLPPDPIEVEHRFEAAERAIAATGADIRYGGDQAFYLTSEDFIRVPCRDRFSVPEFYETVAHELVHWTEHPRRLNWDRSKPEHSYALGELIAELGGCYVVGELGLPVEQSLDNHAAYLRHWLCAMREDSRFLFRATAQASKAADFILSFSRTQVPADAAELVA
jgi:antirestriction protein ArdC